MKKCIIRDGKTKGNIHYLDKGSKVCQCGRYTRKSMT
jgi:hypothetical protein